LRKKCSKIILEEKVERELEDKIYNFTVHLSNEAQVSLGRKAFKYTLGGC